MIKQITLQRENSSHFKFIRQHSASRPDFPGLMSMLSFVLAAGKFTARHQQLQRHQSNQSITNPELET